MARRKAPHIPDALLDQLLAGADARTAFETDGLLDRLKKALTERALNAGMDLHLAGAEDGYGRKTVTTDGAKMELAIPRDRQARFDPQLIAKCQRRLPGFDEKIISIYARGMSVREIVGHLRDLCGVDGTRRCTSRSASAPKGPGRRSVSGWSRTRAPGSGSIS